MIVRLRCSGKGQTIRTVLKSFQLIKVWLYIFMNNKKMSAFFNFNDLGLQKNYFLPINCSNVVFRRRGEWLIIMVNMVTSKTVWGINKYADGNSIYVM